MRRSILPSALLALTLGVPSISLGGDWEHHQFADGKFMMSFPSAPRKIIGNTPDGTEFPTLVCNRNSAALGVSWMPIDRFPSGSDDSNAMATHMMNGLKSNADFKSHELLFINPISYAGCVGADLGASIVSKNGTSMYFRQRYIATKTHLIQIVYTDSVRMPLEPWVGDIFFNSLTSAVEQSASASANEE